MPVNRGEAGPDGILRTFNDYFSSEQLAVMDALLTEKRSRCGPLSRPILLRWMTAKALFALSMPAASSRCNGPTRSRRPVTGEIPG